MHSDKETLVTDSGKLSVLDGLLKRLKEEGHRVLIYSQMTKMIDLLEEYMWHRHHKYMRLDGSSKISERRDMVADFQAKTDIFVFLLSTRAGGLGINLTAADTVIFYDSDWNPTVDQQAMDRAHRLGQTKQVTVYRLICKGSIEERILQRAREKSEIQKLVISGGNFKPDTLKPKEVVSLLLDDAELIHKSDKLKVELGKFNNEESIIVNKESSSERKRKVAVTVPFKTIPAMPEVKKVKIENPAVSESGSFDDWSTVDSAPNSPTSNVVSPDIFTDDLSNNENDDGDSPIANKYTVYNVYGSTVKPRTPGRGSSRRGRPRGSRRVSSLGRVNSNASSVSSGFISNTSEPEQLNNNTTTTATTILSSATTNTTTTLSTMSLSSTTITTTTSTTTTTTAAATATTSSSSSTDFTTINFPSDVTTTTTPTTSSSASTSTTSSSCHSSSNATVRRGPGRPRLKPTGPANAGTRGIYRSRKPTRPLPVPLPSDGFNNVAAAASSSASAVGGSTSTYPASSSSFVYSAFDFSEQND